jgi:alanyl-tRNA synthetase
VFPGTGILTEVLKLDKDRLYVSVFEGNAKKFRSKDDIQNNLFLNTNVFLENKRQLLGDG